MSQAEQRIRERAYQLWQQAGCPAGRSEDFWFAAQREIEGDVPPVGDRPGGAIDYPPESQSVEEPPAIAARAEAAGGTAEARHGDPAQTPRPDEPAAAEAPVPAEDTRPVRAARAVATPGAKKAASSEDTPSAGKRPGKPAPRPGRR
ncbi:MAG: DUF2934 domain-containing protein [Rhodospirillales bacterium]|nr:DUF2934 domain-containing protein [Rhodospirillales bacterium]